MSDPKKTQQNDLPPSDSAVDRQERYRNNKKNMGLIRREIWVYPELWPKIKEFIDKIQTNRKVDDKKDG